MGSRGLSPAARTALLSGMSVDLRGDVEALLTGDGR